MYTFKNIHIKLINFILQFGFRLIKGLAFSPHYDTYCYATYTVHILPFWNHIWNHIWKAARLQPYLESVIWKAALLVPYLETVFWPVFWSVIWTVLGQ